MNDLDVFRKINKIMTEASKKVLAERDNASEVLVLARAELLHLPVEPDGPQAVFLAAALRTLDRAKEKFDAQKG